MTPRLPRRRDHHHNHTGGRRLPAGGKFWSDPSDEADHRTTFRNNGGRTRLNPPLVMKGRVTGRNRNRKGGATYARTHRRPPRARLNYHLYHYHRNHTNGGRRRQNLGGQPTTGTVKGGPMRRHNRHVKRRMNKRGRTGFLNQGLRSLNRTEGRQHGRMTLGGGWPHYSNRGHGRTVVLTRTRNVINVFQIKGPRVTKFEHERRASEPNGDDRASSSRNLNSCRLI